MVTGERWGGHLKPYEKAILGAGTVAVYAGTEDIAAAMLIGGGVALWVVYMIRLCRNERMLP